MKSITIFFLLLSLILGLFPHHNVAGSLVEEVCEHAHSKVNCIASFETNPDSKNATLQQLGLIALKLASENATDISSHIKMLLNDTSKLDPVTEQAFADCSENYIDANDQLDDSVAALLANAHQDVQTWVSATLADIDSCDDGLKQIADGQDSALTESNAVFRQLCNNALAINKLLTKQ